MITIFLFLLNTKHSLIESPHTWSHKTQRSGIIFWYSLVRLNLLFDLKGFFHSGEDHEASSMAREFVPNQNFYQY